MADLRWDQPGADPIGDVREILGLAHSRRNDDRNGYPLILTARQAAEVERALGHPMTVDDIPPGVPGHWNAILVLP